jgi:argininosuccinate lyase
MLLLRRTAAALRPRSAARPRAFSAAKTEPPPAPAPAAAPPTGGKLWGGRFTGATDPLMERFNNSLPFDRRLWAADIEGSRAYAAGLQRAGLVTPEECAALDAGLAAVHAEWASGAFRVVEASDEDIHTANERRLGELIGAKTAGKLHTGRSRNDQVATDVRLWLRGELAALRQHLRALVAVAVARAGSEADILMPGYTHLQPAQPVRWSHWLLSHAWAWRRDCERLDELRRRVDVMPLGSGALAGHAFGLDRRFVAQRLGFRGGVSANSMDAVSDRDFAVETLAWAALLSVHLSRLAEDLILYSSAEFGFVALADAYSTGSSLMPQKKNPDALELLRGKSARVVGANVTLLVLLKGLPSTYNKDLQEDKEPLFDAVDTLHGTLPIAAGVLSTLQPRAERMRARLAPEMLATDLADYLVRRGVPFRETHHVAGAAVRLAEERGVPLDKLRFEDLRPLHPLFGEDVAERVWSFEASCEARDSEGGTSRRAVLEQVGKMREWLEGE